MKLSKYIMLAAIAIPMEKADWQTLSYSSLPKHKLTFNSSSMTINVDKSAMPLIYPLKSQPLVSSICIKGEKKGQINIKDTKKQGEKGIDDFVIRLGIVEKGDETLNWFKKKIAADWVLKLFSLAKDGEGVNKIHFFTAVQDKSLVDKKREHPLGKGLMLEKNVWHLPVKANSFDFKHKLDKPLESLAIWLSTDGDDTDSSFELKINSLSLNCVE